MTPPLIAFVSTLLGLAFGLVGFVGLMGVMWILARKDSPETKPLLPPAVMIFALLSKLPLLAGGWLVVQGLGGPGPGCYGLGVLLVYCLAVWRVHVVSLRD